MSCAKQRGGTNLDVMVAFIVAPFVGLLITTASASVESLPLPTNGAEITTAAPLEPYRAYWIVITSPYNLSPIYDEWSDGPIAAVLNVTQFRSEVLINGERLRAAGERGPRDVRTVRFLVHGAGEPARLSFARDYSGRIKSAQADIFPQWTALEKRVGALLAVGLGVAVLIVRDRRRKRHKEVARLERDREKDRRRAEYALQSRLYEEERQRQRREEEKRLQEENERRRQEQEAARATEVALAVQEQQRQLQEAERRHQAWLRGEAENLQRVVNLEVRTGHDFRNPEFREQFVRNGYSDGWAAKARQEYEALTGNGSVLELVRQNCPDVLPWFEGRLEVIRLRTEWKYNPAHRVTPKQFRQICVNWARIRQADVRAMKSVALEQLLQDAADFSELERKIQECADLPDDVKNHLIDAARLIMLQP